MGESRSAMKETTFQALIDAGLIEIGDGYRAKNNELGGTGPLFLRAGHVSDTHISFDGVERFHAHLADVVASKMSKPGDVVITTKGNSTGRTAFITPDLPPFVYSPHLSYWRSKDHGEIVPGFLRAWSNGAEFTEQLDGMKLSTDMAPYLSLTDQRRLHITLPPPAEQRAIARVLGGLDDKIELNRRMNRTLEDLARGMFRSWFVDFDPVLRPAPGPPSSPPSPPPVPPARRGGPASPAPRSAPAAPAPPHAPWPTRLTDSPLGPIPEGWRVGTVGEEFNLTMGQSPPGSTYNEDGLGVPFYQGRTDFGFRFPTRRVHCTAPTRFAEAGDTLVSVRAPVGDINMADERCAAGRGVAAVRHKSGATSYTYAMMGALRDAFDVFNGDGTLFGCIGKADFDKMQVLVPPPEIVAAFERIARPWDEQIATNEREARSLAATRDAILPVLLSGEVRLRSTGTSTPPSRAARPGAGTVHAGAKGRA
ncbi:MAG: hypothetical protein ACK5WB_07965 [Phycisphaerales bacterium]